MKKNVKRILCLAVLLAAVASVGICGDDAIRVVNIWTNTCMATNSTYTCPAIDLASYKSVGEYSLQITAFTNTVTQSVVSAIDMELSNDGAYWANSTNIAAAFTANVRTTVLFRVSPLPARYFRFRCAVTGGPCYVDGHLLIQ